MDWSKTRGLGERAASLVVVIACLKERASWKGAINYRQDIGTDWIKYLFKKRDELFLCCLLRSLIRSSIHAGAFGLIILFLKGAIELGVFLHALLKKQEKLSPPLRILADQKVLGVAAKKARWNCWAEFGLKRTGLEASSQLEAGGGSRNWRMTGMWSETGKSGRFRFARGKPSVRMRSRAWPLIWVGCYVSES